MSDQWYHQAFGQEFGPFSEEDLARMLVSGELTAEDAVRDGSSGPWVPAGTIPELMNLASAVEVETAEVAMDIDSFMLVEERTEVKAPPAQPQAVQRPVSQPVSRAPITAAPEWYFQTFGEIHGPVTLDDLGEMVQRREIGQSDAIRRGTTGEWIVAGDNPTLFPQSQSAPKSIPQSPARAATPSSRFDTPSGAAIARPAIRPQTPSVAHPSPASFAPAPAPAYSAPDPAADVNWYCYVNEQELGPMGISELQGLAASGHVTPEVYVKYGPQGEWTLASLVPNLLPAAVVPASNPLDDLIDDPLDDFAAPPPTQVKQAAPASGNLADAERSELAKQLFALLKQEGLSTVLMDTINPSAPQAGAGWYCNISGSIMGPVTIETLVQMVLKKRIFPDDLIRLGNSGEWFPASTVPDLFPNKSSQGKKNALNDGQNVMNRIDQMYREAQDARAKAEKEKTVVPVQAMGSQPVKINAADDALRSMSSIIARGSPAKNQSSGGESMGEQFQDLARALHLGPKSLGVVVVIGLLVAGYFLAPSLFGDFAASRAFDQLTEINSKLVNAREGDLDPAAWEKTSKPYLDTIADVTKNLGVVKPGTPRRDVSRMAGYLKKMVETAATKPVEGADDEFARNSKLFEDYLKTASKKLGKK